VRHVANVNVVISNLIAKLRRLGLSKRSIAHLYAFIRILKDNGSPDAPVDSVSTVMRGIINHPSLQVCISQKGAVSRGQSVLLKLCLLFGVRVGWRR
jgi:hypothetical protein